MTLFRGHVGLFRGGAKEYSVCRALLRTRLYKVSCHTYECAVVRFLLQKSTSSSNELTFENFCLSSRGPVSWKRFAKVSPEDFLHSRSSNGLTFENFCL